MARRKYKITSLSSHPPSVTTSIHIIIFIHLTKSISILLSTNIMFGFDQSHEQVYGETTHKSTWSHELIAGAAAFEAMKSIENGNNDRHKLTKEAFAAFVGAEADNLIESKGLDFVDREKVQRHARMNADRIYDEKYA
ncbi:hypothetical protein BGZ51_009582 [Haplosporangium sp. Z 767]|nr:hypothetical protein BGZ51_009582 [Haplosporangium sp. Z 767]KAF9191648.1 hypothetical protein BGZ50_009278 [Haplosporangium sp. Z 11]